MSYVQRLYFVPSVQCAVARFVRHKLLTCSGSSGIPRWKVINAMLPESLMIRHQVATRCGPSTKVLAASHCLHALLACAALACRTSRTSLQRT